ncbi:dihydrofolate reductase family protein [Arthrobacter sp. 35W]|uniref:dihydrofolate reductase family protein n=1 Tax=Arthrobacter sp. 35W TaxID=1132441 RepID=UPI00040D71FD|nr:dihydrofolate reductase family protein [Arthrobacter sp. 35W]
MALTQYFVASSLDGFIAEPDGGLDWLMAFNGVEGQEESYASFMAGIGAIVMGAETYRFLLNEQAAGALDEWPYPGLPTWVVTHAQLPAFEDADITFTSGDIAPVHAAALAAAGGANVWMVGGGSLAAQFHQAGLLDELVLTLIPVALGSGRQLLPVSGTTPAWTLLRSKVLGAGAVELTYRLRP